MRNTTPTQQDAHGRGLSKASRYWLAVRWQHPHICRRRCHFSDPALRWSAAPAGATDGALLPAGTRLEARRRIALLARLAGWLGRIGERHGRRAETAEDGRREGDRSDAFTHEREPTGFGFRAWGIFLPQ